MLMFTSTRWRAYLSDWWLLFLRYRQFAHRWHLSGSPLAVEETRWARAQYKSSVRSARWYTPRIVIIISPAEVNEIAQTISDLPSNFDPVEWLEETWADVSIVATEAVKDVVWEALAIGLADHPLVLRHQAHGSGRNP